MRKVCGWLMCAGLFLLLLSTLLVTPQDACAPCAPPAPPREYHAAFAPAPASAAHTADAAQRPPQLRGVRQWAVCAALTAVFVPAARDANGRVLTAARYENSVYQLFHPEVAGG